MSMSISIYLYLYLCLCLHLFHVHVQLSKPFEGSELAPGAGELAAGGGADDGHVTVDEEYIKEKCDLEAFPAVCIHKP